MPVPDLQQLRLHENLRLTRYRDTLGNWTIGYGHLWADRLPQKITLEQAESLLRLDAAVAVKDAGQFPWLAKLGPNRQNVVIDMIFNLGITRFKKFTKLIAALAEEDFDAAAREMLDSLWARQVKTRADRLSVMMRNDVSFAYALIMERKKPVK